MLAVSKREANKIDKLNRIRNAARTLFSTRGYDDTTMRDIAAKAKVALGTLFLYASNKRDLLFLIANDTMEDTRIRAARLVSEDNSIIDNFLLVCVLHFEVYGAQPELFKLVLRELLFYDTGEQGVRATRNRAQLLRLFAEILEVAEGNGEVELPQKSDLVGWVLFSILQAEIRRWIALERRDLAEGIVHLWASAAVVLNGIARKRIAANPAKSDVKRLMTRVVMASRPT
jgi:AcrR family transcriptional regulator